MLESFLFEIPDHRRGQGRVYKLGHILFFSILAILSGATSYRKTHTFIEENYKELNGKFNLNWKRMPAYTTIRNIIQGASCSELEHWLVENSNHYVRDVTMLEDSSRIRINAHIFAKLRSFALNTRLWHLN